MATLNMKPIKNIKYICSDSSCIDYRWPREHVVISDIIDYIIKKYGVLDNNLVICDTFGDVRKMEGWGKWCTDVIGAVEDGFVDEGGESEGGKAYIVSNTQLWTKGRSFYENIKKMGYPSCFLSTSWKHVIHEKFSSIAFYALCLEKRKERKETVLDIKMELPGLQIVPAYDAADFSREFIKGLIENGFFMKRRSLSGEKYVDLFGRPYQIGALGCFLSHKKALQRIKDGVAPYGVIFEDDVLLLDGFHERFRKALDVLPDDFDIANFYVNNPQRHLFVDEKEARFIDILPGFIGLQCYMVRKESVDKILGVLEQYQNPIDEQLSRTGGAVKYIHLVGMEVIKSEVKPSYMQSEGVRKMLIDDFL